jgi:hypothetical protein
VSGQFISRRILFTVFAGAALFFLLAPRLPAPISEESPTPAPKQPAKPKPKVKTKPAESESSERTPRTSKVTAVTFVAKDTVTRGNWRRTYGADGYNIPNLAASYPRYAMATPIGEASYTWANSTGDVRGLYKPGSTTDRFAGCWFSSSSFTVDLNLTDGLIHRVSLYCVDWDIGFRAQTIDILDALNNSVLSSQSVTAFNGGQYLIWDIRGHVTIRLTSTGFPNAVLSGLFFDTRK